MMTTAVRVECPRCGDTLTMIVNTKETAFATSNRTLTRVRFAGSAVHLCEGGPEAPGS